MGNTHTYHQTTLSAVLQIEDTQAASRGLVFGVTVNAARTNLHRMFEKTGMRSQPVLGTVLLRATASPE